MSTYDDEMYKFIAAKDNFEVAAEIYNLFPKVKERIATEFWETVEEKIIELDTEKMWVVEYLPYTNGIYIYKDDWEAAYVAAEDIDKAVKYGIRSEKEVKDEGYGRKLLSKNRALKWFDEGKSVWLYITETEDNFQEIATLKKCTKGSRESFVNEWAKVLLDLANNTKKDLEKINKIKN